MSSCRIDEVIYDENSPRPVLTSFQNGELIKGQENKFACNIYQNKDGNYIPTVATNKIIYAGEVNRDEDLYNTFLCIKNKKTNKMRFIAVDQATLKAQLPTEKVVETTSTVDQKSYLTLSKEFGSKRSKVKIEQREKLMIGIDSIKDTLEETVAGMEVNMNETDVLDRPSYLPPVDINATTIDMVYKLDEIIPPYVFDTLESIANQVLNGESLEIIKSDYVKGIVKKHATTRKIQILLYIDCLIYVLLTPAKQLQVGSFKACSYSDIAASYILNHFSIKTEKGRIRPLSVKDKTVCYILVLTMMYNGNTINMDPIANVIKYGGKKLFELSRMLLFSFDSKNKKQAFLKLPLPKIPTVKTGRIGRK